MSEPLLGDSDAAPTLNGTEQEAMNAVLRAYNIITQEWRLRANHGELTAAVHTIQGFIAQHMLSRLAPGEWGDWWEAEDA